MALNLFAKSVFAGEFPLTAEFRSGPRNDKKSYQIWKDAQMLPEGYPVDLQTNVLRFSSNNFEYANRFAGENPNMLILSTWRAASGQPKDSRIAAMNMGCMVDVFSTRICTSMSGRRTRTV